MENNNELLEFYETMEDIWKRLYDLRIMSKTSDTDKTDISICAQELKQRFHEAYLKAEPFMDASRKHSNEIFTMKRVLEKYSTYTNIEENSI